MAKLDIEQSLTVKAIYDSYTRKNASRPQRRLGASSIGQVCQRRSFYDFRWASVGGSGFDGRMLRLFETGHLAESRFVADLKAIGCEVHDRDSTTNEQFTFTAVGGHFVDKMDAAVLGLPEAPKTWHACEFKTHGEKSFKELEKKGVRESKPEHYAQLMCAMHLGGMDRGLYLAVNKNTDHLYAERIRYSKQEGEALLAYAAQIVTASDAPPRGFDDPDSYPCTLCPHRQVCWPSIPPHPAIVSRVSCRNCVHATAVVGESQAGIWKCEKHNKTLSETEQLAACDDHLFLPSFIAFAKAEDANADAITYRKPDNTTFTNGNKTGQYKSVELTIIPHTLIGTQSLIEALKKDQYAITDYNARGDET